MPDLTGDVFESTFSNEQNKTTNEDLLKELRSQTRILEQINASIEGILNSNQGNRYQYEDNIRQQAYNSNGRNNTTRERQGAKATRNKNNRSFSDSIDKDADSIKETLHKLSKALGDSVDSFEKGLRSSLFSEPEISKIFNQHMVNLADSLGVELDELPQKFGEQISKMFKNYVNIAGANGNKFAETLGNMVNQYNAAQGALNERMSNLVQKGISKLFPGIDTGSYSDITGQIFSKNQKSETDEQSESDTDKNSAFNKIFDRSEKDYLNIQSLYIDQVDAVVNQVVLTQTDLQNLLEDKIEVNSETELKYPAVVENVLNKQEDKPLNKNLSSSGYSYSRTEQSLYIEKAIATAEQVVFTDSDSLKELLKNAKNNNSNVPNPADYTKEEPKKNDSGIDIKGAADETAKAISGATGSILSGIATMGIGLAVEAVTTSLAADFKELKSELSALVGQVSKVAKRYDDETRQIISNSTKRLMDDVETIVREPFQILEDAANKVYDVWDNELRIINATQGYTKSDMQDLMSNYAARITEAGLSSVVNAADMTENLAKVLESGLSGAAAEEFAYIATILDAAIPTQEFFDYADTYVALAGNMIAQGYSESEALEYANEQLELFASNTLYASRELAGGFTTGLKNAADIFQQSAQIAQTASSNNVAEISSVLTAVAAITGSIAPDLATSMTDLIYQAATGGNSSELVALRSLAGINASNTEFLNALVNDPQSVFVTMFKNLNKLINTSNDNYMEVAESLSEVFGISTDALRRIDFNYLANAIDNMNVSDASLSENLALLASGETTTSAEQLRMQQINEYLLDEGLAYVVDNEAARFIQQHMWEEQIANDLMDATYGVEMVGDTKELMTSIWDTVLNIATLGIRKVISAFSNRRQNRKEENAEIEDLETILEAGKVGEGNVQDLYNLMTSGAALRNGGQAVKLDLTEDLVTLLTGQQSAYSQTTRLGNTGTWARIFGTGSKYSTADVVSSESDAKNAGYHSISSMYSWSTNVSKSNAAQAGMLSGGAASGTTVTRSSTTQSSTAETESRVESKIEQMLSEEYIRDIIENGGGYTDWEESAKKFGIADISSTLEDLGYVESEIESYFQSIAATMSAEESNRFYEREEEFWDNVEMWLEQIYTFMDESIYQDALIDHIYQEALTDNIYQDALVDKVYQEALLDKVYQDALTDGIYQHALMDSIYSDVLTSKIYENSFKKDGMYKELKAFYDGWYDYIYQHNAYNESYDYSNVASIQAKEKTGSQDAVYALAEELTKNTTNLLDPTMQTNALLAQILIVVNAIMQNENASTSATSLSDTLSGLALGLFNTSTT